MPQERIRRAGFEIFACATVSVQPQPLPVVFDGRCRVAGCELGLLVGGVVVFWHSLNLTRKGKWGSYLLLVVSDLLTARPDWCSSQKVNWLTPAAGLPRMPVIA